MALLVTVAGLDSDPAPDLLSSLDEESGTDSPDPVAGQPVFSQPKDVNPGLILRQNPVSGQNGDLIPNAVHPEDEKDVCDHPFNPTNPINQNLALLVGGVVTGNLDPVPISAVRDPRLRPNQVPIPKRWQEVLSSVFKDRWIACPGP